MLCYLRALLFKNSWYHYVILQRWGHDTRCGTKGDPKTVAKEETRSAVRYLQEESGASVKSNRLEFGRLQPNS